jgi:uroporphyrinogen III methyltransferase/synthase
MSTPLRPAGGARSLLAVSGAQPGTVYLVGAGPGDPGLLTVRARALLDSCDAIVYDALANPRLFLADERAALHFVGKRGGHEGSVKQSEINALLIRLAREGKSVVRLKGGDPFVFGRGGEEAQALAAAGLPFEVVPGVTAGVAAPAYAGIPVTHRGLATTVTFVTGHEDPTKAEAQTDWDALARAGGTIVLYMGVKRLRVIAQALIAGGRPSDTPAASIQWGTLAAQRTIVGTLETIADVALAAGLDAPVITVIGQAVAVRSEIAWFDRRPLFGRRILVTRSTAQAGSLSERLRAAGADVLEMPATRIEPLDRAPLDAALGHLGDYRHLVVTSQNAVAILWAAMRAAGLDARALAGISVSAVGSATADALLEHGIAVDILPARYVAEGVLEALAVRGGVRGTRVLYPTAEGARDVLPEGLRALGATVDVLPVYRSAPDGEGAESVREAIAAGDVDLVTFTSASTARGYVDAVGRDLAVRVPAASIGPITTDAARALGVLVEIEAPVATIPGLADAIIAAQPATARLRVAG